MLNEGILEAKQVARQILAVHKLPQIELRRHAQHHQLFVARAQTRCVAVHRLRVLQQHVVEHSVVVGMAFGGVFQGFVPLLKGPHLAQIVDYTAKNSRKFFLEFSK